MFGTRRCISQVFTLPHLTTKYTPLHRGKEGCVCAGNGQRNITMLIKCGLLCPIYISLTSLKQCLPLVPKWHALIVLISCTPSQLSLGTKSLSGQAIARTEWQIHNNFGKKCSHLFFKFWNCMKITKCEESAARFSLMLSTFEPAAMIYKACLLSQAFIVTREWGREGSLSW